MIDSMKPVVIAGGGLAGLTALALLARAGRPAILFERASAPGGRARSDTNGGYTFNLGAHALYRHGAGKRVLDALGVPVIGKLAPASGAYAYDRGVLHTMPAGLISLLTTDLLRLPAKLELARFFARLRVSSPADAGERSAAEWIDAMVHDPDVRRFVRALARVATYIADLDSLAASNAASQMVLGLFGGVFYLDGGWQTLVDGLRKVALEAGGKIVTGRRVVKVEHDDRARAVILEDGERIEASAVILAVPPNLAAELVGGAADPSGAGAELAQAASRAKPVYAACLDVALSALPNPRARFALGIDRPLYLSVHSETAKLAPEGGALIHLAKYLGPAEEDPKAVEAELETLLDLAQPGWRELVVERRFLPHMAVVHAMMPAAGARQSAAVKSTRGLFVAGDWVGGPEHLADAAFASAKAAADAILAEAVEEKTKEARAAA